MTVEPKLTYDDIAAARRAAGWIGPTGRCLTTCGGRWRSVPVRRRVARRASMPETGQVSAARSVTLVM
jgi:hypothetical protein